MDKLQALYKNGIANGITEMELLTGEEAQKIEPNLSNLVTGALRAKNAGIISPYEAAIAFAENAAENGAKFVLNTTVTGIKSSKDGFVVHTTNGDYSAAVVINAAGVESGNIHNMAANDLLQKKEANSANNKNLHIKKFESKRNMISFREQATIKLKL